MPTIPDLVIAAAQAAQRKWGVPASISLAQWALESGWGLHEPPGSNNPFGITVPVDSRDRPIRPAVASYTWEWKNDVYVRELRWWRVFNSIDQAFDAHGELLATLHVYRYAMSLAHDPIAMAHALTGVYATDPHYADKIVALIEGHDLGQYDQVTKPPVAPTTEMT